MKESIEMSNSCTCGLDDGDCDNCWDSDLDYLDSLIHCAGIWQVEAHNIGWNNKDGFLIFEADNAEEWIMQVVGFSCEWTFKIPEITQGQDEITAFVYHHDSPTGETRIISKSSKEKYAIYQGE